ncbi:Angiotensin-converting enzyme [Orchesella cincta]|uniref:Angiotensin-converting enzyme n=1 Tax=Orchesella cincta TaxID=48709 RepID=A0A1D2MVP3_ORCCI|nr:Angiotensin-converting enzyme [Orchesella cincta]
MDRYVALKNKLARANGYKDYGDELRQNYETLSFETDIRNLYEEMKPLYMELHAYVRRKLYDVYGPEVVDINVPFPDRPNLDITDALIAQNYTVRSLFEKADEFYKSMGLLPLPNSFYNLSMLERPDDRPVICHPISTDLHDGKDFRIRMCASVGYFNFLTIQHELGHIQYFMQFAHQPAVYRDGANDGFHEAIGELMSMCVSTPKHLYNIGLLDRLLVDNGEFGPPL